jgi:hypothetical protein
MQPSGPTHGSEPVEHDDLDDDEPGFDLGRRQIVTGIAAVTVIVAVLYVGLPLLPGIEESFGLIRDGQPLWLAASLGFAILSFVGYVLMFRGAWRRRASWPLAEPVAWCSRRGHCGKPGWTAERWPTERSRSWS